MTLCYAVIFLLLFTKEISNNSLTASSKLDKTNVTQNTLPAFATASRRSYQIDDQSYLNDISDQIPDFLVQLEDNSYKTDDETQTDLNKKDGYHEKDHLNDIKSHQNHDGSHKNHQHDKTNLNDISYNKRNKNDVENYKNDDLSYENEVENYKTNDLSYQNNKRYHGYQTSSNVNNSTNNNGLRYQVGYTNDLKGDVTSLTELEIGRRKRSAVQLYSMVSCSTGCDPLSYKGYGCYCGFLGSGTPVDPIDRCCELHDWCYTGSNCPMFLEYFIPYVWTCFRGRPRCQRGRSCSHRLCECDRRFSECLRPYSCPRYKAVCRSNVFRLMQNLLLI
uniref:Phospholipase A2 n=1 Tax=Cacopsylla melanoneura TaxID=428564 RepID=A0A8D8U559_9HEMI